MGYSIKNDPINIPNPWKFNAFLSIFLTMAQTCVFDTQCMASCSFFSFFWVASQDRTNGRWFQAFKDLEV